MAVWMGPLPFLLYPYVYVGEIGGRISNAETTQRIVIPRELE
jgi:hypothetical protein